MILSLALIVAAPGPVVAAEPLQVCADPFSLPTSSKEMPGYENRIAELMAAELERPLEYEWFPQRIGFIRNTLRNNNTDDGRYKCDIVMGVIENFELAATSRPYLHSAWAMVYVKGRGLDFIESQSDLGGMTDEQKARLRIGLFDRGPAAQLVFRKGLMEYATPIQSMSGDARESPGKVIERDLINDTYNLTFIWGPIAGYYAKQIEDAEVVVIPLHNELGIQFDYQISMAVRFGEQAWLDQVNAFIEAHQPEIDAILAEYGVPMLPLEASQFEDDD